MQTLSLYEGAGVHSNRWYVVCMRMRVGALRAHCRDMYLALDARVGPLCGARCVGVGRREPEEFHWALMLIHSFNVPR